MIGNRSPGRVALRRARLDDMGIVFNWRNDPFILDRSSSRKAVGEAEHERWFTRMISDPDCLFFIIELDGIPLGQIRLERETPEQCVVSIYLVESQTGHGHGPASIRLAREAAWQTWPVKRIVAQVRDDNLPGQRAFAAAGFERVNIATPIASHRSFVSTRNP